MRSDIDQVAPQASPSHRGEAPSLTDQAYADLEERIVTLQLAPGDMLSELALAEQVGLGRTPIREALQRLAREGLVVILPRKGILVSQADAGQQLLVLEVRRELERLLCRLAAMRASSNERIRLGTIAEGMERAAAGDDDLTFMRLDRELNDAVTAAAHNPFAAGAMRLLQGHSRRFWFMHHRRIGDLPRCARLHAAQARAVADGDGEGAIAASDALLDYTVAFTRDAAARG